MQTRTRTFLLTESLNEYQKLKINLKHTDGGLGSETMLSLTQKCPYITQFRLDFDIFGLL